MAAVSAHSWPMRRKVPNPLDCWRSRSTWLTASSTVPMTAKPEALRASTIDLVVGGVRGQGQGGHPLEVVDPLVEPELDIGDGLLLGVGDVHGPDQPPLAAVDGGPELGRPLLHDVPVQAEHVEAPGRGGPDGEQAAAEAAGGPGSGRRHLGGHGHLGEGALVGPELQAGLDAGGTSRSPWSPAPRRPAGARMASSDSSIMSRWRTGSIPIMKASEGRAPGPTPIISRPRVRWSRRTSRSASMKGWW